MKKPATGQAVGALALIEQALYLLRRGQSNALAAYYTGTLPFVLGLLYFWSDMSRNALAINHCSPAAAGVALLFIWMKLWHVRSCRSMWCALQGQPQERWPWSRYFSTACRQAALQASGFVILPIAAILLFPLGWAYAYYQNLTVMDDPQTKKMGDLHRAAKEQSLLWPAQNHIVLSVLTVFGLLVFLNCFRGLAIFPYLLKFLFGVDTVFTMSGMHLLNTTYLAVLCALTYLCVDPIIKAVYVLRCYYGESRRSGDDLRTALKPYLKSAVLAVFLAWLAIPAQHALAKPQTLDTNADLRESVSDPSQAYVEQLDDAIETTLQQRHFAWRLPKDALSEPDTKQGLLGQLFSWLGEKIRPMFRVVGDWIGGVIEWLVDKLILDSQSAKPAGDGDWSWTIRLVFYILGGALALLFIYLLVRGLLQRRPGPEPALESDTTSSIDIGDEQVTAQDLPLDGWLAMAQELMDQKDFKKAMRALYFSVLAVLGDKQRLVIARYKSNYDYARELARRAHAEPDLLASFGWCVRAFERSWYGTHPVSQVDLEKFVGQQERIATIVETAT